MSEIGSAKGSHVRGNKVEETFHLHRGEILAFSCPWDFGRGANTNP